MIDKRTRQEILTDLAINKNLKELHSGYHGSGALFNKYDPTFGYTGEGAQVYGKGLYSGSIPQIGEHYKELAEKRGKTGYLYEVGLPEQYKYYDTSLPSNMQSDWVKQRLGNEGLVPGTKRDIVDYIRGRNFTDQFLRARYDFLNNYGRFPENNVEFYNFLKSKIDSYPKPMFDSFLMATENDYNELGRFLKERGIVGTTHPARNGAYVNVTFDPDDIIMTGPNGVSMPKVANVTDTNKTLKELLQGYRRAFNPANRTILSNPYLKPFLKSLGTTLRAAGAVGDAAIIYEASKIAKQKMIEDYDKLPIEQKQLIGDHMGMNPRAGEDWKGLRLPLVQVNDNTPLLKGGVKYDDYILEPLGDDVYMQRMPDERFNN